MSDNSFNNKTAFKWRHPSEVMALHQLKKKALQARMNTSSISQKDVDLNSSENICNSTKRKNPFITNSDSKRIKSIDPNIETDESADNTLFKLLHLSSVSPKVVVKHKITSFNNILSKINEPIDVNEIKVIGEKWIPIDWTLKTKVRFLSTQPFAWNQKLKISEEASGITSFTRCLDTSSSATSLDTSPNSKFHQCCLYWQQPSLPWLSLFPRTTGKASAAGASVAASAAVRESLQIAFTDSLRSLFQLIRTRQCPYFYACANSFTILFRAAGICGFTEMHAIITPTTRGFRHLLRQEDIEFTMPLKKNRVSDQGQDTLDSNNAQTSDNIENIDEDESPDELWLKNMGINAEDIKQINYTQEKIIQKSECLLDNSEQSLILIEGLEVQALYNFLINCKSTVAQTGLMAGVPPTLLAPVAYNGATLTALKVRESKVHVDQEDYYSLDLIGPILPHTIHNLCALHPKDHSMTATFSNLNITLPFSKVLAKSDTEKMEDANESGGGVFRQENLSDCGLIPNILKHFCSDNSDHVSSIDCLKYTAETNSYAWS